MVETNVEHSYGKERAQRLRRLREYLRLSRKELCEKYKGSGITASTLQSWEDVRWKGLTEKGANNLAKVFQAEGLTVTVEWLLFGIGKDPISTDEFTPPHLLNKNLKLSEDGIIAQELRLFHQLNPNATDAIATDDAMAPWLMPGDHVAGKRYFENEMENAIGSPSIVQISTGVILIRMVHRGSDKELYTLTCTNANTTMKKPIIKDVKLFSAAPIIWIRKIST